ncbi:TBP-associated factor 4 isoform 1 [Dorcoceras hygrometricum]|uniref:TBP-associated factor 4 isoform 1 n=1 Tax=Dorcoceras hygrometricum TaxID=472368 RepID=A0A2Z7A5U4_9LAMI|nr:TBP-associated factor 4 isoform 1 [Dorcoceras hygrometricum]
MDPNIMKILEEDEDETMHSGADVEAFTAELNRDIEGDASTSQQPSDTNAALSPGNCHTASQFLQQWQSSDHDETDNFQSGKECMEPKDQQPTQLEIQQAESYSKSHKKEDDSAHEFKSFDLPSADMSPQPQDDKNTVPVTHPMCMMTSGENLIHVQGPESQPGSESYTERDSQLYKLQDESSHQSIGTGSNNQVPLAPEVNDLQALSTGRGNPQTSSTGVSNGRAMVSMNQHAVETGMKSKQAVTSGMSNQQSMTSSNQQPGTTVKLNKQVPFGMLLPIIQPQLDNDRAMQLQTLYSKLRVKNEISKDKFVQNMRSLVGDQMLKMAVYKLQTQAAKNLQTPLNQHQLQPLVAGRQLQVPSIELRNPTSDSNTVKSQVGGSQVDSQGLQVVDKQQHPHFSQTSYQTYGNSGSNYSPFSATNLSSSTSVRPQLHDSQMRQAPAHQNITSTQSRPTSQNTNLLNISKFERPPFSDPNKMQARTSTQQNQAEWASSTGVSSLKPYAKQEPVDQSSELQLKAQLNSSQGLSNLSSAQSLSQMSSPTPPAGSGNYKVPLKKPLVGQKKLIEAPGSSPPSSKKQKVSGAILDQSIDQLNDVTAVSGVNLREEEEQLFSGSKEDSRVSEASRRVVQEEEERLILHKIPLQKQVMEIMAKYGLKNMNGDVERCLSLCVEERMRGIIANLIRLSKQRVDMEKLRHRTVVTSDVREKITTINRKAREEWEKKQAETEKSQKLNETESDSGVDGDKEKDESRIRSAKANKDEDDKMRATAANVAVRAATGVGDMLSRWQSMIEAKQKLGGTETLSGSQPGKDVARVPIPTSTRNTRENQEAEKRDHSPALSTPASVRKVARNRIIVPRVARSISVKDVVAVLEREPQMSKSTLIYRLYDKISADAAVIE